MGHVGTFTLTDPNNIPIASPRHLPASLPLLFQVGTMYDTAGAPRAFVYDAAHGVQNLNTLTTPSAGFVLMGAYKINERGVIVGYGAGGGGFYKSYVLTPPAACGSADFNCDGDVGTDGRDYCFS